MRRHSWKSTGQLTMPTEYPDGTYPGCIIERCLYCDTERTREHGSKTLYLYRGGKSIAGRSVVSPNGWSGYTVIPQCVER